MSEEYKENSNVELNGEPVKEQHSGDAAEGESFQDLLDNSYIKQLHSGDVVEGTVIDVKDDEIILSIPGSKSEGVIVKSEYSNEPGLDLRKKVQIGDKLKASVMKVKDDVGMVSLSYRRAAAEIGLQKLKEAYENKTVLHEKVTQVVEKGLVVEVQGTRVFIPASMVSDTYERDLTKYAGQEIDFVITEFSPNGRRSRIIGDRKQLMIAKKAQMKKELFERIKPGDVVEGTVKNVTDFGAFIDLGGADGLLHISEMSWGRVENPKKIFHNGDKVKCLIKDINGEKIALSLKFPETNPWLNADEKYAAGTVIEGRVARMTDFGAFIELEPGIDALLHVSQISRQHVDKPSDVLKVGQVIRAKVVDFNGQDHKISLSIKALENQPQQDDDVADVDIDKFAKDSREDQ